jgi:hypothetical protein
VKALTIWQPMASLLVFGYASTELRTSPPPEDMVGQEFVVVSGRPAVDKARQQLRVVLEDIDGWCGPGCKRDEILQIISACLRGEHGLPYGVGLGTATLGKPHRVLGEEQWALLPERLKRAAHVYRWPLFNATPWEKPKRPIGKGDAGFHEWREAGEIAA